jgi:ABC-2 type transport system permease protein
MKDFFATFRVESHKMMRSGAVWLLFLLLMFVSISGLLMRFDTSSWKVYLDDVFNIFSTMGFVGCGFVTSWVFGREYADRTMKDLLVLPVSRYNIVLAKYAATVLWCASVTILAFVVAMILGKLIQNIPGFSIGITWKMSLLTLLVAFFNLLLCTPIMFLASRSKGYLVPICIVFIICLTVQIFGKSGQYFPWTVPPLYAASKAPNSEVTISWVHYAIMTLTSMAGLIGTLVQWRFSDQK